MPSPTPLLKSALQGLVLITLLATALPSRAQPPDPGLLLALDEVWQLERPGISTLSDRFERKDGSQPARFETDVRDALAYLHINAESAEIEFARKRFPAGSSPWGALPRIAPASARLLEVTLPRKRYLLMSGTGEGLFGIGDWQRFGFLHVVDVTQRWAPVHYPLVAEAGLRERVIGRLPGSPVLNYLRLVPARWSDANTVERYEVLVYALNAKGPERVRTPEGEHMNFSLTRDPEAGRWLLSPLAQSVIADTRDLAGAAFSAPPTAAERSDLVASASTNSPDSALATTDSSDASPVNGIVDAQSEAGRAAVRSRGEQIADEAETLAKNKAKEETEQAARESASSALKKKLPGTL